MQSKTPEGPPRAVEGATLRRGGGSPAVQKATKARKAKTAKRPNSAAGEVERTGSGRLVAMANMRTPEMIHARMPIATMN